MTYFHEARALRLAIAKLAGPSDAEVAADIEALIEKALQTAGENAPRKYTVRWAKETERGEVLECTGLTPRVLTSRLRGAVAFKGPIVIVDLVPEARAAGDEREGEEDGDRGA